MSEASAAIISDAANPPRKGRAKAPAPPVGSAPWFDKDKGELHLNGTAFRAKLYTRRMGRELRTELAAMSTEMLRSARDVDAAGENVTDDQLDGMVKSRAAMEELNFEKIKLLYVDAAGNAPTDDELDDVTYSDAAAAVTHATADPTVAATGTTSG